MGLSNVAIIVLIGWSFLLTGFTFYIWRFFRVLSKDIVKENLISYLNNLINIEKKNSSSVKLLTKECKDIKRDLIPHIQKIGLVRFNPFNELGGDHSFALCLLDAKDNGVIITSLHARDRTRFYIKELKFAKSDLDLSSEEKKALTKAQKSK